jgi:hypothetical protein
MRILGIPNEQAAQHDDETVTMDDRFARHVEAMMAQDDSADHPTLH